MYLLFIPSAAALLLMGAALTNDCLYSHKYKHKTYESTEKERNQHNG